MDEEIKKLQERFGPKGMQELARLDGMGMNLLWRLYLVSSIAANLNQFDEELARNFYNGQSANINYMMADLEKFTQAFQEKRGEI